MDDDFGFLNEDETKELMEQLKRDLGVKTNSEVFRKALEIAKIAVEQNKMLGIGQPHEPGVPTATILLFRIPEPTD